MPAPVSFMYGGKVPISMPYHQSSAEDTTMPKIHYLTPTAGSTTGAWTSQGLFLDFELPRSVGSIRTTNLRFDIANNTDPTHSPQPNIPTTPFLIQQIEVYIGQNQVEVLYPADIFNETVGFMTTDEIVNEGNSTALMNTRAGFYTGVDPNVYSALSPANLNRFPVALGSSSFYLNFNNCLTTSRLFVAGCTEPIKYRVYLPNGLFSFDPAWNVTLNALTLVLEEDALSWNDRMAYERSHQTGIIYNSIVRQRQNQSVTKNGSADLTVNLTGLSGSTVGLMIYVTPVVSGPGGSQPDPRAMSNAPVVQNNSLLTSRVEVNSLELDDVMGSKITEELRSDQLRSYTWYEQVGNFFPTAVPTYLLPFCSDFRKVVQDGVNCGRRALKGDEKLVIRSPLAWGWTGGNQTWNVTITNYAPQAFIFRGGKLASVIKA